MLEFMVGNYYSIFEIKESLKSKTSLYSYTAISVENTSTKELELICNELGLEYVYVKMHSSGNLCNVSCMVIFRNKTCSYEEFALHCINTQYHGFDGYRMDSGFYQYPIAIDKYDWINKIVRHKFLERILFDFAFWSSIGFIIILFFSNFIIVEGDNSKVELLFLAFPIISGIVFCKRLKDYKRTKDIKELM